MSMTMKKYVNDWDEFPFFSPFEKLGLEVSKLFGMPEWAGFQNEKGLPTNLFTEGNDLIVRSNIPGMKPEEISVNVKDNILTIDAERKNNSEQKEKKFIRNERIQTQFHGTINLPAGTQSDKVTADYKDGVLTIRVPRTQKAQPKQIAISCNQ